MPKMTVRAGALWLDETRIPLLAGEMHYWRLNPARWPDILRRVREAGVQMIATYVPWEYHELAPGRFDFTGDTEPTRNLVSFLDLLHAEDFWIFIRPGPYIYAEWTNAGVPDRVVTLPRLSDTYRDEAHVWMRAVSAVITPYQATRGGRIVLFQPDNEMDLFSHWFESECGLDGARRGFFHDFLRATYADVDALNAAWGTQYASLDDAQAHAVRVDDHDAHARARQRDYWRFQHWATAEGVRWHVETYRALGIELPMVANYYPGGDVQNWREVRKTVDFCGIDWYPRNEFGGDAAQHRRFLDTCRMQRVYSPLPCIAEFECGVWHGFHDYVGALSQNHYRLMTFSALVAGIQGINWYMFVARDNWLYSPINERGEARPEAEVFHHLHRVFAELDPPTLRKVTDTCVAFDPVHIGTDGALRENALLGALHAADIDFELFDPELNAIARPLMLYAGVDWLPQAAQQRLLDYVENGGTLVLFQNYPRRDERFRPHNGLGITPPDRILSPLGKKVALDIGGERAIAEGAVWCWDQPPGEPLVGTQTHGTQQAVENADKWMMRYVGKSWTCGYRQQRGRGTIVMIGLPVNADLLHAVHRALDVPLPARADLPDVHTALFERDGEHYLIATNLADADRHVRVEFAGVDLPAEIEVVDLWTGAATRQRRPALTIRLPRRGGSAFRLSAT